MAADSFYVVSATTEFAGDRRREHFVEQQLHRASAACPAIQAA
jgi:hypothetical protein